MTDRPFDHGELNIPNRHKNLDAEIDREMKRQRQEKRAAHRAAVAERKARREAEKQRVKLTREEIVGARAVRDIDGYWYKVVRVNQKTVTVSYWPIEYKITFDKILEVRK